LIIGKGTAGGAGGGVSTVTEGDPLEVDDETVLVMSVRGFLPFWDEGLEGEGVEQLALLLVFMMRKVES
jgi:hypothetical protein